MKIPEKFHNSLEEAPFKTCNNCQKELINSNSEYLIEKAYKQFGQFEAEELLFEIAICMDCANTMRGSLSKESKNAVENFFMEKSMARKNQAGIDPMAECLLTGKPLTEMEEYQIYAYCQGDSIAMHGGYYVLSDDIIEAIQSLLSAETKEELQRFTDEHTGMPPELKKLFSQGDLLLI